MNGGNARGAAFYSIGTTGLERWHSDLRTKGAAQVERSRVDDVFNVTGEVGSDVTALERPYFVFGLTVTFPSSFVSTLAGMASLSLESSRPL